MINLKDKDSSNTFISLPPSIETIIEEYEIDSLLRQQFKCTR